MVSKILPHNGRRQNVPGFDHIEWDLAITDLLVKQFVVVGRQSALENARGTLEKVPLLHLTGGPQYLADEMAV